MTRLPGINVELAAAVREVNAAYFAIPEPFRPEVAEWDELDTEVDAACAAGDRDRALAAIEAWRSWNVSRFTSILANCPLERTP